MFDYGLESQDRMQKIASLKKSGVIVYANNYRGKQDIVSLLRNPLAGQDIEAIRQHGAEKRFRVAGRLVSYRSMGRLAFGAIIDATSKIQVCFERGAFSFFTGNKLVESLEIDGEEWKSDKIMQKYVDVGDYIGVVGDIFTTHTGEITLYVKEFQILSKAIRPLPEKFHGLTNRETIYRQRYLDLISNDESYNRFVLRSKFIHTLRSFYHDHSFLEIETPILGNAASGAAAKPFITHHNDFDEEFFLRISPETALKKATVGRFERVVEFAKDFRNEGSDPSHMQEFTMIEHYAAWWNFEDNMSFTQKMFDYIFEHMPELKKEVMVKDKAGQEKLVNFATPWPKIDYIAGVKEACGIDVSLYHMGDEERLRADIKNAGVSFEGMEQMGVTTLIDYLYKKVLRPSITGPAFVYNYPKTMQPLARQSDENPDIVEQFQVVINGWEVIKAYSELVDPEIQKANFEAQSGALESGDEEATAGDDDFVLAMEYGMPPQSGWGMGIDRIFSLLTGQENLRDVVLFPLMKSLKPQEEEKKEEN